MHQPLPAAALSFVFLGIYWNNHHHMLTCTHRVTGAILWANLHLLFWLSLVPFVSAWMGEHPFVSTPATLYGVVLLMAGIAYWMLQRQILRSEGPESILALALGRDLKGKLSPLLVAWRSVVRSYILALPISCTCWSLSCG
jgi:uncharacterized membrane protein